MKTTAAPGSPAGLLVLWTLTRTALLLCVLKVIVFPGPDVTSDVSVIYRGWYDVLSAGTFPQDDVTWQYPPAAALAILSPGLLPFLGYATAFFVLALVADLVTLALLLYAGRGPGRARRGAWVWVAGVPLLGPTVYARYDVMVTAVAVAALLAGVRHPRVMGALVGFGALLKVWPALLLVGVRRRGAWVSAVVTGAGVAVLFAVLMPGAFAFLTFQKDRGTEVESLGALVFHVARHHGWEGEVLLNYGSVEFLGPYVNWVSTGALFLTGAALVWLVVWRALARRLEPHTVADAAFVGVLLFTTTSRVISPQYMVWLVGLAAVCLCFRDSRMGAPVVLVLGACLVTVLEFPVWFAHVVASDALGVSLLVVRNGLLVAAAVLGGRRLWHATVPGWRGVAGVPGPAPAAETPVAP
ncbi:glycosyltransferase family 87 protein [Streptomyces pilosus]|uniref:Membrane protein n=1 Tax=Streptomyces pilosus TaxID=28893 RepID=A0A918BE67_9ACTN|nr:glycosyltransferase family 87 protein [Streptomyces pilosus]GGQ60799.1 membrane protein [Streptomyces pilosus]